MSEPDADELFSAFAQERTLAAAIGGGNIESSDPDNSSDPSPAAKPSLPRRKKHKQPLFRFWQTSPAAPSPETKLNDPSPLKAEPKGGFFSSKNDGGNPNEAIEMVALGRESEKPTPAQKDTISGSEEDSEEALYPKLEGPSAKEPTLDESSEADQTTPLIPPPPPPPFKTKTTKPKRAPKEKSKTTETLDPVYMIQTRSKTDKLRELDQKISEAYSGLRIYYGVYSIIFGAAFLASIWIVTWHQGLGTQLGFAMAGLFGLFVVNRDMWFPKSESARARYSISRITIAIVCLFLIGINCAFTANQAFGICPNAQDDRDLEICDSPSGNLALLYGIFAAELIGMVLAIIFIGLDWGWLLTAVRKREALDPSSTFSVLATGN
jgi:hypothetical protein